MTTTKAPRTKGGSNPLLVILAVAIGFFALAILPRLMEQNHPLVGKPLPALSLPALSAPAGKPPIDLASYRGKVVVLDFWASWCGPCRHEMPVLDKIGKKMAGDGVVVLGVLVDADRDGARAVLKQLAIEYPQLDDETGAAAKAFAIRTLPTLVVVDRKGTIRTYRQGFSPEEDVEAAIRRAM